MSKSTLQKAIQRAIQNPSEIKFELARRDFYRYLLLINESSEKPVHKKRKVKSFKAGWWQKHAAGKLQEFYNDFIAGKRPKLVIEAPPQHGKSELIVTFISWVAGKHPELATIYTSFSKRLGVRANLKLRRIYQSSAYQSIFPETFIHGSNDAKQFGRTVSSMELLEYGNAGGSFRNTTVLGAITGESLDLGVIDDPIKGREAANSKNQRDKVWDWFTDDFFTRFSEDSALLAILTRWHIDDPIGRLIERDKSVQVLKYPAIADEEAKLMDDDPRKSGSGEALFPEHKSREFLLERKSVMLSSRWLALYQQSPIQESGTMFKVENFKIVKAAPAKLGKIVRYWDKAGTEDGGARTAGVKMATTEDNQRIVLDVKKGQWSALQREKTILQTAQVDGVRVHVWIEQEPGSGGKESAESTIRNLSGYTIKAEKVTGAKELRAEPYSAQVEAGNILLLDGPWVADFIEEHRLAPDGLFKDQWDAAGGAFNKLVSGYNLNNL